MSSNNNDKNNSMSCAKRNTKADKPKLPRKSEKEPLYFASVYRYSCLGHVSVPTDSKQQGNSDRVCKGIQYGLQHAAESHRLVSRQEATRDFAILNSTAKDRQSVSPGMPKSLNDLLKTQAVEMKNSAENESNVNSEKEWNEVDSYGITDVEVLVLQDSKTKKTQVASVAPHCFVGTSMRDVGTHEGQTISATVHLGPLEITLDSGVEEPDADQHQNKKHASKSNQQVDQPNSNSNGNKVSTRSRSNDDSRSIGTDPIEFGKKVANNMVKGASMLRDAVSEDFPSRMYDASHRVVGQMGKTVERTGKVGKSLYRIWFDSDDDGDNDGQ